jgi:carbonic anhydrase/acetyltransferase-like protein (isoleucine patch superfamily)
MGFYESWELLIRHRVKSPKHVAGLIFTDMGQWFYKLGASCKDNIGGGVEEVGPRFTHLDTYRNTRQLELWGPHSPTLTDRPLFFAPSATLQGDVRVGKQCSFWFNSLVRAKLGTVEIGDHVHILERAIVKDTDGIDNVTSIGNYVVIEQGAVVEGCSIGDGARIGAGAIVMPGSVIGEGAYIKPNTVVLQNSDIQFEHVYSGVPATRQSHVDVAATEAFHKSITRLATRYQAALSQQPQTLEQMVTLAKKNALTADAPDEIERKAYNAIRKRESVTDIWPNFESAVRLQEAWEYARDDPTTQ